MRMIRWETIPQLAKVIKFQDTRREIWSSTSFSLISLFTTFERFFHATEIIAGRQRIRFGSNFQAWRRWSDAVIHISCKISYDEMCWNQRIDRFWRQSRSLPLKSMQMNWKCSKKDSTNEVICSVCIDSNLIQRKGTFSSREMMLAHRSTNT